ncbi:hypothetical protein J2Z69_002617 [Paenibacillus shirakamiensis]|uniref:Type 4 fimbrial biogenesis protein PilX N-terminal domain-containing protein n=1 Tax=Paenibacillus shirakamiensis TaxID=1265935 RepID=A0ABS4JIR3_9BACL|nr:hypothetical protein [Paenibacillus shirakamiensis]MBP2001572.1 hypothetical protein [Paenibacillus shirakamiensis]
MKRMQEESGSALVMVLFVVLMLTILGMAVLSASIGGAQRAETRENDVQSLHLAQKTVDEAAAAIGAGLAGKEDISPKELEVTLRNVVTQIRQQGKKVTTGFNVNGISSAKGEIVDITYNNMTVNANDHSILYHLTITVKATVNGVLRKLKQDVTIDTFPDFLKYAIGSESNLIINGAAQIQGNVYAGQKLLLNDYAYYKYNKQEREKNTVFPTLAHGSLLNVSSIHDIQYQEGNRRLGSNYIPLTENTWPTMYPTLLHSTDSELLQIKDKKKFVSINLDESILDKLTEALGTENGRDQIRNNIGHLGSYLLQDPTAATKFLGLRLPEKPTAPDFPTDDNAKVTQDYDKVVKDYDKALKEYNEKLAIYNKGLDELNRNLMNMNQSAVFENGMTIDGDTLKEGLRYTEEAKRNGRWLVVDGDLTIDNYKSQPLQIRGNVLVTGKVIIRGQVAFDSTMFVMGKTTIEDATITGLNQKELVLISKGKILVNRYDAFQNASPASLRAFFYTEDTAELYGVGSAFLLNGGFFSKGDLTIHAVLGSATGNGSTIDFSPQTEGTSLKRFEVKYNEQVFEDQNTSLPRVRQVNISMGALQLMPQD